jgi:hypothetical protein
VFFLELGLLKFLRMTFESVGQRVPRQQRVQCLHAAIHANIGTIRGQHHAFGLMAKDAAMSDEERRVCGARAARLLKLEEMYNALLRDDLRLARQYHIEVSAGDVEEMELMCGKETVYAIIKNKLTRGKETAIYVAVWDETKLDYDARRCILNIFKHD